MTSCILVHPSNHLAAFMKWNEKLWTWYSFCFEQVQLMSDLHKSSTHTHTHTHTPNFSASRRSGERERERDTAAEEKSNSVVLVIN
jgi:hypothetical protein